MQLGPVLQGVIGWVVVLNNGRDCVSSVEELVPEQAGGGEFFTGHGACALIGQDLFRDVAAVGTGWH